MTVYEIDSAIQACMAVNEETGEVTFDEGLFAQLQMERERKLENLCCWVKDLTAEAKAIREEEKNLADRRKAIESKAEKLADWLQRILDGQKLETARCKVSYRKSESVTIADEEIIPIDFCIIKTAPDKAAIKAALKSGEEVPGAVLETNYNMTIK